MQVALSGGHFLRLPQARSSLTPIPRLLRLRPPWPKTSHVHTTLRLSRPPCYQPHHRLQCPAHHHHRLLLPLHAIIADLHRRVHHPLQIDPRPTLRAGPRLGLAELVERDDKHTAATSPPPAATAIATATPSPDTLLHDTPAPSPSHSHYIATRAAAAALAVALRATIGKTRLAHLQGQTLPTPSGIGCPQAQHIPAHT
jgi:hypothetical protein